ncbi:MAG TPA: hypothetical protein PJ982_05780 [Lacipirellulaceae bacterium]|nr:hypothetical protein [Lacipirellulaceae bacterium]
MIVVHVKLTGVETLTRSRVNAALKRAMRLLGEYWHDAMAWKRFTEIGYTEYQFRQRAAKYVKAKRAHRGHNLPLVLTGAGRDEALGDGTRRRIRATRDKVTIPMPRKFNRSNPAGPDMSREVRAVSRGEIPVLERVLVQAIDGELIKESGDQPPPRVARLRLGSFRTGQRIVNPVRRIAA